MPFPIITLSVTGISIITYVAPILADFFIYDRQDVLDGQLWRLFTAPFVHFSASHLICNLLVFAAAGCVIELAAYRRFGLMCILATVVPGLLFLVTKPDLSQYGGLSGLASGATAYLCFCRIHLAHRDRSVWIIIFAVVIAKIIF